jgi:hypothetical protein
VQGLPTMVGRYQVRDLLGSGGFASVYRAYDPTLDREVALKVLHAHLARDAGTRERFIREGRSLARVDHPNVVTVWEAGEADGTAYLAMKLINGRPLEDIVAERGPLPLPDLVVVMDQVAAALAAVHERSLIHRDIKPANIMIEQGTNRAMLLDLGVARDLTNVTMTAGWIVGTPGFMAPEQVQAGGQVTPLTDVYQLGATAYALLSGRAPFDGDTIQVLDAIVRFAPPDLRTIRPDLPPVVVGVINEAMAKDPAQRPQGTRAFAARLRGALEGTGAPAPPPVYGGQGQPAGQPHHYAAAPGATMVAGPTTPQPRPPSGQQPAYPPPVGPPSWQQPQPGPMPGGRPPTSSRPKWLIPVIAAAAVLVVGGAGLAFALAGGGDGEEQANVTPTAAATSVAVSKLSPDEVYEELLAAPFSAPLPQGFTVNNVSEGDVDTVDEQFNAIGVVNVGIAGPATSPGNVIVYTVYPTEADAKGRYDKGLSGESSVQINSTFNPSGLSPAQGINATFTQDGKKSGVSYCVALAGVTHVWGVSLTDKDTTKGSPEAACNLAKAGIEHLRKIENR